MANKKLRQALADVMKTTAAAEETLGLHMQTLSVSAEATIGATWEGMNTEPLGPHTAGKYQFRIKIGDLYGFFKITLKYVNALAGRPLMHMCNTYQIYLPSG